MHKSPAGNKVLVWMGGTTKMVAATTMPGLPPKYHPLQHQHGRSIKPMGCLNKNKAYQRRGYQSTGRNHKPHMFNADVRVAGD